MPRTSKSSLAGLPIDSIAGGVFRARTRDQDTARAHPRATTIAPGSIAAEVFSRATSPTAIRTALLLLPSAVVVYAIAGFAFSGESTEADPPEVAPSNPIQMEYHVELDPPAPEETAPPEPKAKQRVATRKPLSKPDAPGAKPPPPAQAGRLVAKEPSEDEVDFTDFTVVSGESARFAGGVTAPSGTNPNAVRTSTVDPNARPGGPQGEGSLAAPVRLLARNWTCPWPEQAEMLGITEQTVVIRAMVDTAGRAKKVTLLADPGHGFGTAAVSCARIAKFEAARDRTGAQYTATSPPIRVRFTR